MKKIFTICAALLIAASAFAQVPQKMSYQAIIRSAGNNLYVNANIGMKVSILQGSASGVPVYEETQNGVTNANGLISLEIGAGNVVSGSIAGIDWSAGPYFIKTETDPTGGTNYTITGTSELLSVPYALNAGNGSWTKNGSDITNSNSGNVGVGVANPLHKFDVQGNVNVRDSLLLGGNNVGFPIGSIQQAGPDMRINTYANIYLGSYGLGNNEVLTVSPYGMVGVNNTTPDAPLHVNGNVKIVDGNQGDGKVLTSDANGLATWQNTKAYFRAECYFNPFTMNSGVNYNPAFGDINYNKDITFSGGIVTIPYTGLYRFDFSCGINNNAMGGSLDFNGNFYTYILFPFSQDFFLPAGTTVTFNFSQNTGSPITLDGYTSFFSCHRVD